MRRKEKPEIYYDKIQPFRQKCECGHTIYLSKAYPKQLCDWCGKMNYINKKVEFKDKLINALKKEEER